MKLPAPFSAEAARALGGPDWLVERRLGALEKLAGARMPSVDDDLWHYSRIGQLDLDLYVPSGTEPDAKAKPNVDIASMERPDGILGRFGLRSGLVVVADGLVISCELSAEASAAGVFAGSAVGRPGVGESLDKVAQLNGEHGGEEHEPDVFDHLADSFLRDVLVVSVPARVRVANAIVIVHLLDRDEVGGLGAASFARTVVELGESAEATVIELFTSGPNPGLFVPIVDMAVADAAVLSYNAVQQLGQRTWQIAHQRVRAGRDSTVRTFTASFGGEYARFRTESVLAGEGGSAELLAAYLGGGAQMHDFRTVQEHVAPRTTSDLVFKGAVGGSSRSVYSGLIRMRRGSRGANAFQANRNLVLSEGAHAESVPNLDIAENDVRCSHASAVGQIDREQSFYLESRGVPRAVAERLILLGFFEDLWERIGSPGVRAHLKASVTDRLESVRNGS
jgi:Fe-S cluster assembly protein SufD